MAFLSWTAGAILRSAISMAGQIEQRDRAAGHRITRPTAGEIFRRLRDDPDIRTKEGYTPQALRAIATRAVQATDEARRMRDNSFRASRANRTPVDPSIDPNETRYRYRVVVEFTDAAGRRNDTVIDYDRDQPVSAAAIQEDVEQWTEIQISPQRGMTRPVLQIVPGVTTSTRVLSVVRAP